MENVDMYSEAEQQKLCDLDALFADWRKVVARHFVVFKDDGQKYRGDSYFCEDGFLPNYFSQKTKVLFVGREARNISKKHLLDGTLNACKAGTKSCGSVLRRQLYLVYGIKQGGTKKWNTVPEVEDIAAEMVTTKDFGFAFMNISKYSNDSETGGISDKTLINDFLEHSQLDKRNFTREEIEILDPDVIITMNLWHGEINPAFLDLVFGIVDEKRTLGDKAVLYEISLGKKKVQVIDLYHFSAPGKEDKDYYYDPVIKLLF